VGVSPSEAVNPVDARRSAERPGGPRARAEALLQRRARLHFNSWFTARSATGSNARASPANGKYGNPFFDRYQDSRVYLGVSVLLDNLVKDAPRRRDGTAGVVRAQNKAPIRF